MEDIGLPCHNQQLPISLSLKPLEILKQADMSFSFEVFSYDTQCRFHPNGQSDFFWVSFLVFFYIKQKNVIFQLDF